MNDKERLKAAYLAVVSMQNHCIKTMRTDNSLSSEEYEQYTGALVAFNTLLMTVFAGYKP